MAKIITKRRIFALLVLALLLLRQFPVCVKCSLHLAKIGLLCPVFSVRIFVLKTRDKRAIIVTQRRRLLFRLKTNTKNTVAKGGRARGLSG